MRVVIRTKFHHSWLMRYLSQLENKLLRANIGLFKKNFNQAFCRTRLAVRQFRVCLQHVRTYEVRFYLDCRELYTTSASTALPQSLRLACTSRNTVNLLIVLWAAININYIYIHDKDPSGHMWYKQTFNLQLRSSLVSRQKSTSGHETN